MDPASAAGLAVGVASLAFDVFDKAIEGYKFCIGILDMPEECKDARDRLVMEYNRLMAWGKAAGLVEVEEKQKISLSLGADPLEMFNTITLIKSMFEEFRDINSRFKELKPFELTKEEEDTLKQTIHQQDVVSEIGSVVIEYNKPKTDTRKHMLGTNHLRKIYKSSVNTVQSAGTIIANPGRVMWVKVYKETFEGLLDELHRLTNRLLELMDDYRIRKIQGYTARTCLDMIQVRNDVSQLKALFGAVTTWILQPITTGRPRPGHYLDMKALVELKLRSLPVEQILLGGMGHGMATEIFEKKGDIHGFQRDEKDDVVMPRTRATLDRGDGKPVWVEWKSYDLTAEDTVPDETKRRTAALAELLSIPKPADFCTPQCLGFLDGRTWNLGYSYGWVFELPVDTAEDVGPVSLFELLEKGGKAPSISSRVKMAEKLASCVLYMHTVSWLHKGIRSDNVLFLPSSISASPSLSTPTLSGFEYARPESSSTTKRSDPSLKWDIYRWPSIQRAEPTERNSRKTYDVYSLGLVLLEIAHWKPLYEILGLGRWPNVSLKDSKAVRERVLQEGCVGEAGGVMGGRYEGVVRRCVEGFGEGGLGVREGGDVDETSPGVAVRLQGWFIEGVVEELKGIDV